ncbi:MAG: hypothetical protein WDM78_23605 [Puia sp.]
MPHIFANYEIATSHSPMAGAFADAATEDVYINSIRDLLTGEKLNYTCDAHPV